MGTQGLFFSLGQTEQDYGPESAQVLFICQPSFLCLCLSLFVGPGGSELNLFGGGVGHPSVVKQWVLATGDARWPGVTEMLL